jgi:hypothetical protein
MFSREVLEELGKRPLTVAYPPNYFYPFPGQRRMAIRNMPFTEMENALSRYMYLETYAMHLWYCSWQRAELL